MRERILFWLVLAMLGSHSAVLGHLYDGTVADRIGLQGESIRASLVEVTMGPTSVSVYHAYTTDNSFFMTISEVSTADPQTLNRIGSAKVIKSWSEQAVVPCQALTVIKGTKAVLAGVTPDGLALKISVVTFFNGARTEMSVPVQGVKRVTEIRVANDTQLLFLTDSDVLVSVELETSVKVQYWTLSSFTVASTAVKEFFLARVAVEEADLYFLAVGSSGQLLIFKLQTANRVLVTVSKPWAGGGQDQFDEASGFGFASVGLAQEERVFTSAAVGVDGTVMIMVTRATTPWIDDQTSVTQATVTQPSSSCLFNCGKKRRRLKQTKSEVTATMSLRLSSVKVTVLKAEAVDLLGETWRIYMLGDANHLIKLTLTAKLAINNIQINSLAESHHYFAHAFLAQATNVSFSATSSFLILSLLSQRGLSGDRLDHTQVYLLASAPRRPANDLFWTAETSLLANADLTLAKNTFDLSEDTKALSIETQGPQQKVTLLEDFDPARSKAWVRDQNLPWQEEVDWASVNTLTIEDQLDVLVCDSEDDEVRRQDMLKNLNPNALVYAFDPSHLLSSPNYVNSDTVVKDFAKLLFNETYAVVPCDIDSGKPKVVPDFNAQDYAVVVSGNAQTERTAYRIPYGATLGNCFIVTDAFDLLSQPNVTVYSVRATTLRIKLVQSVREDTTPANQPGQGGEASSGAESTADAGETADKAAVDTSGEGNNSADTTGQTDAAEEVVDPSPNTASQTTGQDHSGDGEVNPAPDQGDQASSPPQPAQTETSVPPAVTVKGDQPSASKEPPGSIEINVGEAIVIPLGESSSRDQLVQVDFGKSAAFMNFDDTSGQIVIDRGATSERDVGTYLVNATVIAIDEQGRFAQKKYSIRVSIVLEEELPADTAPAKSDANLNKTITSTNGQIADQSGTSQSELDAAALFAQFGYQTPAPPFPYSLERSRKPTRTKLSRIEPSGTFSILFSKKIQWPITIKEMLNHRSRRLSAAGTTVSLLSPKVQAGVYSDPELLTFTWSVVSVTDRAIACKIDFDHTRQVSQNMEPDFLSVEINLDFFVDEDFLPINRTIKTAQLPRLLDAAEAEVIGSSAQAVTAVSSAVMGSNMVINLLLQASISQLWQMLNGLQLTVHMPLFHLSFPANTNFFISFILTVANFEIIPSDVVMMAFDFPDAEPFNEGFDSIGYGSMYPVENLGTSWLLMQIYLVLLVLWFTLRWISTNRPGCPRVALFRDKLGGFIFWGAALRFLFQSYLELCLAVFIGWYRMEWGDDQNATVIYSNCFTVVMSVILVAVPFWIAFFFSHRRNHLTEEVYRRKYGTLYAELDVKVAERGASKSKSSILYLILFIVRRLVFALSAILVPEDLVVVQLIIQYVSSLVIILLIRWWEPFKERKMANLETFNEVAEVLLLYHLMMFTEWIGDPELRFQCGWSFIAVVCVYIAIHLTLMGHATGQNVIRKCKVIRHKRRVAKLRAKNLAKKEARKASGLDPATAAAENVKRNLGGDLSVIREEEGEEKVADHSPRKDPFQLVQAAPVSVSIVVTSERGIAVHRAAPDPAVISFDIGRQDEKAFSVCSLDSARSQPPVCAVPRDSLEFADKSLRSDKPSKRRVELAGASLLGQGKRTDFVVKFVQATSSLVRFNRAKLDETGTCSNSPSARSTSALEPSLSPNVRKSRFAEQNRHKPPIDVVLDISSEDDLEVGATPQPKRTTSKSIGTPRSAQHLPNHSDHN